MYGFGFQLQYVGGIFMYPFSRLSPQKLAIGWDLNSVPLLMSLLMVAWFKEIIFQRVYFKWISKAGFVFIKWKFNWKEYEKNLTVNCRYLCLHRLKQCMAMGHNYHKTWIHLLNYFHQDKKIWNKMTKNAFWINLQITNGSTIMLVAAHFYQFLLKYHLENIQ